MKHGLSIFILIDFFFVYYSGLKINRLIPTRPWKRWLLAFFLLVVMIGWQFLYRGGVLPSGSPLLSGLAWTGSVLLGLWATYLLYSLPYDLLALFMAAGRGISKAPPLDPRRRAFLTHWIPVGLFGVSALETAAGFHTAVSGPVVKEIEIPVSADAAGMDGLRIAQISDLHVSPLIGRAYVENIVEKVMNLGADMIVLTGDLADGTPENLAGAIAPLGRLKAPLGSYYITGNHEYYWDAEEWVNAAADLGFTPLMNSSRILKFKDTEFLLGGVTDTSAERFNPSQKSSPRRAMGNHKNLPFKLLLAHRPESCYEAAKVGWDLQLSGHTHAGQFFPFSLLMPFAHQYYRGLNRHKGMWLYVNRGTGYWGPPHRFTIPSEITLIRLSAKT